MQPPILTQIICFLDVKHKFHATQVTAWQRGLAPYLMLNHLKPSNNSTLNVADAIDTVLSANVRNGKAKPVFMDHVCKE